MTGQVGPGRRVLATAVLACAAGAGLVLLAAGQPWASAVTSGVAGPVAVTATGAEIVPLVPGLAVLALAGSVALLATRRTGRRLVGAILAVAGAGIVAATIAGFAAPDPALREAAGVATGRIGAAVSDVAGTGWPWLALAGGLVVLAVGLAAAVAGPRWSVMSSRYERGAEPAAAGGQDAAAAATDPSAGSDTWIAQDKGIDPTV
ncbi:MAG TPA: Trp biosynthesis-associated membrane protein [Actinomycetes bacterium]|nr:Trp biosynthesis-associated membrane protein [Actinomycetes bacterium]